MTTANTASSNTSQGTFARSPHDQAARLALRQETVKALFNGIGVSKEFRISDREKLQQQNSEIILMKHDDKGKVDARRVLADSVYLCRKRFGSVYYLVEAKSSVEYDTVEQVEDQVHCIACKHKEILHHKNARKRKGKKNRRSVHLIKVKSPHIVPLILYTGRRRWTAETNLKASLGNRFANFYGRDYNIPVIDVRHMPEEQLSRFGPEIELAFRLIREGDNRKRMQELIVQHRDDLMEMDYALLIFVLTELSSEDEVLKDLMNAVQSGEEDNGKVMRALDSYILYREKTAVRELLDALVKEHLITKEAAKKFAGFRVSRQTLAGKPKADTLFVSDTILA